MLKSQTRSALCSRRLLTGAIRFQDMYERHLIRLTTFYAKNLRRLAIRAALHHHRYKSFPCSLVANPLLAGVFRQDPHRTMF